jgi:hypothetical protein
LLLQHRQQDRVRTHHRRTTSTLGSRVRVTFGGWILHRVGEGGGGRGGGVGKRGTTSWVKARDRLVMVNFAAVRAGWWGPWHSEFARVSRMRAAQRQFDVGCPFVLVSRRVLCFLVVLGVGLAWAGAFTGPAASSFAASSLAASSFAANSLAISSLAGGSAPTASLRWFGDRTPAALGEEPPSPKHAWVSAPNPFLGSRIKFSP